MSARARACYKKQLWLRAWRDHLIVPLAQAAAQGVASKIWSPYGFARCSDYALQSLSRSGRWLRDLAALHATMTKLPALRDAVTGADDGLPIGQCAALWIGRIATSETLQAWIDLARRSTARELRVALRAARTAKSASPVEGIPPAPETSLDPEADDWAERKLWHMTTPRPVRFAFDETLDLHRAVAAGVVPVESLFEAFWAEFHANGNQIPEHSIAALQVASVTGLLNRKRRARPEKDHAPFDSASVEDAIRPAEELLARLDATGTDVAVEADGSVTAIDARLRSLIAAQDAIERELGRCLAWLDQHADWSLLGYSDVFQFATESLRWKGTAARQRLALARKLTHRPILRQCYEAGRIGAEAAALVCRVLGPGVIAPATEQAWVTHAEDVTVRRLRDELRIVERKRVSEAAPDSAPPGASPRRRAPRRRVFPPATDTEWRNSLYRSPGSTWAQVYRLGWQVARESGASPAQSDVFLAFDLPEDLALKVNLVLEQRRIELETQAAGIDPATLDFVTAKSGLRPSVVAACKTYTQFGRVLPWVALLSLLEDYVKTHDNPKSAPYRRWQETYRKANYRCMAPGCTSRDNLQDHHIQHRSQGGSDEPENQICLCAFHHLQGVHGEFGKCLANGEDVLWRLGREDLGVWYRNDRRVPNTTRPPG